MADIRYSAAARDDLDRIWDYIAPDDITAADAFIDLIVQKCESYAHQPLMGELRSDLFPGIRQFPIGVYIAFYRASETGIEVIRLLHGARDVDGLL